MKKLLKIILLSITFISINLLNPGLKTLAVENVDWVLLKENNDGKEWIDIGSLKKYDSDEISVLTKYSQNPTKDKVRGDTSLYVMRINCSNRKFKDISRNGIPNFKAEWKDSNNDELIDIVIDKSCSEIPF